MREGSQAIIRAYLKVEVVSHLIIPDFEYLVTSGNKVFPRPRDIDTRAGLSMDVTNLG